MQQKYTNFVYPTFKISELSIIFFNGRRSQGRILLDNIHLDFKYNVY